MRKRSDASRVNFHRKRLRETLSLAIPSEFITMLWCVDCLLSSRHKKIGTRFRFPRDHKEFEPHGKYWLPSWELEQLANEFFCTPTSKKICKKKLNCAHWDGFVKCLNLLKAHANSESVRDIPDGKILDAMPRLFVPQYKWQIGWARAQILYRYWSIYSFAEAHEHLEAKAGITVAETMKIGFAAYSQTDRFPAYRILTPIEDQEISQSKCKSFAAYFGKTIPEMTSFARETRRGIGISEYKRSPIREKPLILSKENGHPIAYVPIRELLMRRISEGLYYDLVDNNNVRRIFGERFESYCFEVAQHYFEPKNRVDQEIEYSGRKSPDILVSNPKKASLDLVIECKARKIPLSILESPDPKRDHPEVYADVVKGIVQVWRFVHHCRYGQVERFERMTAKDTVGIVLTLDPWLVMGNQLAPMVYAEANKLADRSNVPQEDRVPVSVVAVDDWERSLSKFRTDQILKSVRSHVSEEYIGYLFDRVVERIHGKQSAEIEPYPWKEKLKEIFPIG